VDESYDSSAVVRIHCDPADYLAAGGKKERKIKC